MKNKIGLSINVIISENTSNIFKKDKIFKELTYLFNKNKDYYLVLKNDKESLAIMYAQSLCEEDEIIIFKINIDKNEIKLTNSFNSFRNFKNLDCYYETINNLNYSLWRSLPKIKKDDELDNNNEKV